MKTLYLLELVFAAAVAFAEIEPVAPEGSGKKDDPYLINKLENFFWLSQASQERVIYCKQTADIDASRTQKEGEPSWPLIANYKTLNYDGQGYSIISPYISDATAKIRGVFSYGIFQIKNLNIKKAKANFEKEAGAILVGEMNINGENRSMILSVENCNVDGKIHTGSSASVSSGLINTIAVNDKTVIFIASNCFSKIDIQGERIGAAGLISRIDSLKIKSINVCNSASDLTVNCEVFKGGGGLIGGIYVSVPTNIFTSINITDCCSLIDISSEKGNPYCVGGLLGQANIQNYGDIGADSNLICVASVLRCHSAGKINIGQCDGEPQLWGMGGFIGLLGRYTEGKIIECYIEDCYSDVNFDLYNDYGYPAGFIGRYEEGNHNVYSPMVISHCYASNFIKINNPISDYWEYKKPFIGQKNRDGGSIYCLTVTNCYSNKDYFEFEDEYATGKTGRELKQRTTFKHWDFENVWDIDEGVSFPYLISEVPEPFSAGAFVLALLIALRFVPVSDKK